ncbi:MAG: VRR-NUC domain-containing protein [Nanoarchaeota archaeon]|nr:VRR-NUC domain-containing protein [Nanoarchaeota archaeon]
MNIKPFSKIELAIINKFSKYIIEFNNNTEFLEYIKKNKFKVEAFGLNKWWPSKYYNQIEKYLFYDFKEKYRLINKNKFKILSDFEYIAIFLKKKSKELWLLPLDEFIRWVDNSYKTNIDKLIIEMGSFNNKLMNKEVMIYLNRESMNYDVSNQNINTDKIYRKYVGTKKFEETSSEETRILVEGSDGTIRDINQEAIHYFQEKGFWAVLTKEWRNNYLYNFFKKKEIAKIFKKSDLKKIQEKERIERPYQFSLTGFPDLFVWDTKGNYFFVEVKSEKDKLHRSQYEWIRWNNKKGKFNFKILNILDKK